MWKSCTVDAVVADGFALTGRCKVVRASLLVENRASCEASTTGKPAPRRNSGQR